MVPLRSLAVISQTDDIPGMANWLDRKEDKYTSPDIQKEILEITAQIFLREIMTDVKNSGPYSVLAEETADVSNVEELVICSRWVDEDLIAHEECLGMHPLKVTSGVDVFPIIKDILLRLNLNVTDARGQCYDGAGAMMGVKSGVSTRFKEVNSKMLSIHCFGHAPERRSVRFSKKCERNEGHNRHDKRNM